MYICDDNSNIIANLTCDKTAFVLCHGRLGNRKLPWYSTPMPSLVSFMKSFVNPCTAKYILHTYTNTKYIKYYNLRIAIRFSNQLFLRDLFFIE